MKVLFMMDRRDNAGSIQAVTNYVRAGDELGHTLALYGRPDPRFPCIRFSTDLDAFDYTVFIVESDLGWMSGLRLPRILAEVPRHRRAILDTDGMYNCVTTVGGYDRNHASEREHAIWLAHYDRLADRIFQPTTEPREVGVTPLPFYGYDPTLETRRPAQPSKCFDILHVGHNWWRWQEVSERLLPAFERIRKHLRTICFVGAWWDGRPPPATDPRLAVAFRGDREWFRRLGIRVRPPVPYTEVIATMSKGRVNIMTQRPLLRRFRLLTSKYFEIFSADTIPLVALDPDHAESIYGPAGRELALHDGIADLLLDALERPRKYQEIVQAVRGHLAAHHSYHVRVQQLVTALQTEHDGLI